ncbi:MAG: hypothetical protein KGH70_08075 [Rhodospirillales bacterium]|nr:hypothetical protein [Rhodospirillales bacterium]
MAEGVSNLMRRMHNGIAGGIGAIAEALSDIIETAADMALSKIVAGGVEIFLRATAIGIAGGKSQGQGKQAQARQPHLSGSFHAACLPARRRIFNRTRVGIAVAGWPCAECAAYFVLVKEAPHDHPAHCFAKWR